MYIDKDNISKIEHTPIVTVAQRLGLVVNNRKAHCPFHDDRHPSLTFNTSTNRYRCYVCGAHGNCITLVMQLQNIPFVEACKWIADECSTYIPQDIHAHDDDKGKKKEQAQFDPSRYMRFFEHPFLSDAAREFLFGERRLDPRVVRWCRLTTWKDWLQIPYFDIGGKLTGVQWRYLGTDKSQPRFRFPKGSRCGIYNLRVLDMLKDGEPLFITEGCSDCWAMLSAGHKAIAIPSATLLKGEDADRLSALLESRHTVSLHCYPDADVPGERLFCQLKERLPRLTRHQLPKGFKDFAQYWASQQNVNC